jgi:hypothetical protein
MAQIAGVSIENITSIAGVSATSISNICGIATTNIPGWPTGGGASCTTLYLGYADGRRFPPGFACSADQQPYDYDSSTGILYTAGGCGDPAFITAAGYYSDGSTIYDFTNGILVDIGTCAR